jgi:hypothetical protein
MSDQDQSNYHSQRSENIAKNIPSPSIELPHYENEFILCNLCLWCASSVRGCSSINTCPVCRGENVQAMPISDNDNKYNTITSQAAGLFIESL